MTEVMTELRLSPSKAGLLLPPSCPAAFRWAVDNPPEPTKEQEFGSLAHRLLLGAGDEVAYIDAVDYKTKAAQEARAKARADGLIPALPADIERAGAMVAAVHDHPFAGPLLADGHPEHPLEFVDPETGVLLRGRVDWLTMVGGRCVLVEYKTSATANPRGWARRAADYGYHLQAAWYVALAELMGVDSDPLMRFVVQEKDPPYLVSVVELDGEALALGARQMRRAIDIYYRCWTTDTWPGYTDQVYVEGLPPWIYNTEPIEEL